METYTIGGVVIVYGIFFGITKATDSSTIPLVAWWLVPSIVLFACVRCWSHYLYIRRLSIYISMIESQVLDEKSSLPGFETFNRRSALGPTTFLLANIFMWASLLSLSVGLAVSRSIGYHIPSNSDTEQQVREHPTSATRDFKIGH